MNVTTFKFVTEAELARRAGMKPSALESLRKQGRLQPVGIVGIVALIMAIGRLGASDAGGSVYDARGILLI